MCIGPCEYIKAWELTKLPIKLEDKLYGAYKSGKGHSKNPNFYPISIKLGSHVGLVKL